MLTMLAENARLVKQYDMPSENRKHWTVGIEIEMMIKLHPQIQHFNQHFKLHD